MQYQKAHSAAKDILTQGPELERIILQTMKVISDIVGATLGPGGRPVLIERQEDRLPPMVTKDGVTVYRSLGFPNSVQQSVMEAARDASVRTATEAGDGTTTASILSEAVVRMIKQYCDENPRVSPQRVVRRLERAFREVIEPTIKGLSIKANITTDEGRELLRSVARVSANGDAELADAVMKCFALVGDDGNVTIAEINGPSQYEVEQIDGYPVMMGYEESGGRFYPKFVNDVAKQRVYLDRPAFVLYNGQVRDVQTLMVLLNKIAYAWQNDQFTHNVVLVANGFSEAVLGYLAMMFAEEQALNVFPLLVPQSPFPNGQLDNLLDLAATTTSEVFDPLNRPLDQAEIGDLGRIEAFEAYRFRSNIIGKASKDETSEDQLIMRVDELKAQLENSASQLDATYLQERVGKLTGGIARLKVMGVSNGELKEKRDRAEDAVCAVRGAVKHGCLPGGCWTLLRVMSELLQRHNDDSVITEVLVPALFEPMRRLLSNVGIYASDWSEFRRLLPAESVSASSPDKDELYQREFAQQFYAKKTGEYFEFNEIVSIIWGSIQTNPGGGGWTDDVLVFDAMEGRHMKAIGSGILDSTPAVVEAIRNSLSIAALLGTLGGTVVFPRDQDVERREARDMANWMRDANKNEANERA